VLLVGMRLPPNFGPQYTQRFAALFPDLAKRHQVAYLPFLLAPIADEREQLPGRQHAPGRGGAGQAARLRAAGAGAAAALSRRQRAQRGMRVRRLAHTAGNRPRRAARRSRRPPRPRGCCGRRAIAPAAGGPQAARRRCAKASRAALAARPDQQARVQDVEAIEADARHRILDSPFTRR
jgi:hypothetical protein